MAAKCQILTFRPAHNSHGKRDVTHAFAPEAERFMECMDTGAGEIVVIDNNKPMAHRRRAVLEALEGAQSTPAYYDAVAFFCHGWIDGIQLGFRRRDVAELAPAIYAICDHHIPVVPLYCCSTGDDPQDRPLEAAGTGEDSFADRLRDGLCAEGATWCRVAGHTTVAHTTKNPFAIFFDGMGSPAGGVGGYPPVGRKPRHLWTLWRKALQQTDLRFRFPFMTIEELHAELMGGET